MNPLYTSNNTDNKDNHFKAQFVSVYNEFYKQPQSMKMLSVKLGIDRANICWYCRELRKNNKIGISKKGVCSITKRIVNFYTTNPELIATNNQYSLFE